MLTMTRSIRWAALAAVVAVLAMVAGPGDVRAQDTRVLLDRIDRLERDLSTVQRQLYRNGVPASSPAPYGGVSSGGGEVGGETAARLQQRITDMETVLTNLTGQVEEANFQVGQVRSRVEKLAADIEFRLAEMEKRLDGSGPAVGAGAPAADAGTAGGRSSVKIPAGTSRTEREAIGAFGKTPGQDEPAGGPAKAPAKGEGEAASLPKGSPKEQYDYLSSLLSQGNYAVAEKVAAAFLEAHPNDPLAGNAQYWLGETFYVRGDFTQAAVAFAKGYQKYPKSSKAAANVLKLGLALAKLDRVQDACTAFNRLASEFPNAPGDLKQRAALEKKKLSCNR